MFLSQYLDHTIKIVKSQAANFITLLNLSLGATALLMISAGQGRLGMLLIFVAAFMDRLDGMVARKFKIESEFGKQLDSMCDIVSFGVAPALLIYFQVLHEFGAPGLVFTVIYIACGAIRLAKFNISENNGYFIGLPITVTGVLLTFATLAITILPSYVFMCLTIAFAILMISPFKLKKI